MLTLKQAFDGVPPKSVDAILSAIGDTWEKYEGNAHIIKKKLSPELFNVHICSMIIAMSQSDGWYEIIANNPQMLKYIPQVMCDLGYLKIGQTVNELLKLFPPIATFEYDDLHFAIVNFLENERRKVTDERLNQYTNDERAKLSAEYINILGVLDDLSEELWGYNVPEEKAWTLVFDYIEKQIV